MELTEHQEAVLLAEYLDLLKLNGKIELYSHLPHETYTSSWSVKRKNKAEGVKRGVPDYIIITKCHVLFIELKRRKGGVFSLEQQEWIGRLQGQKIEATMCKGFEEAKEFIEAHI